MTTLYPNCFNSSTQHDSGLFSYQSYTLCIQNNQLSCLEGCTVLLEQQVRCFNPRFQLWRWCNQSIWLLNTSVWVFSPLWLGVTHCNFPELLWRSSLLMCDACPASVPLRGWVVGLYLPSLSSVWLQGQAMVWGCCALPGDWTRSALALRSCWKRCCICGWSLGAQRAKGFTVFLGFFYCVLLCFLWMVSFGKQECSEKNIWSCWVRRKPYQQLIWMGIAVVDGRSRLWYVMSNSCLSSILLSECFLTIFFSMENLGVVLSFLLVISQFS